MVFIYDTDTRQQLAEEIRQANRLGMTLLSVSPSDFRHAVRVLTRHNKAAVPTPVDLCTPIVERMRAIAGHCGVEVVNMTAYLKSRENKNPNRPVAAAAVPPVQQQAAAGHNH